MIENLLVIDDDLGDQKLYKRIIKRSGTVKNSRSFLLAEEALDFLRTPEGQDVDAILLDVRMPRMNGFEFLDAAQDELAPLFDKIAVFMFSTSTNREDIERSRQYSCVRDYLEKPLSKDQLEKVCAQVQSEAAAAARSPAQA